MDGVISEPRGLSPRSSLVDFRARGQKNDGKRAVRRFAALALLLATGSTSVEPACGQSRIHLIDHRDRRAGWRFDAGSEFPGARVKLTVVPHGGRSGEDCLELVGDFRKGGKYVEAGRQIPPIDPREISLWVRNPDSDQIAIRLIDVTGQTHQLVLKTSQRADWQRLVVPLGRLFRERSGEEGIPGVARYESWGGAKDDKWHTPATAVYLLLVNPGGHHVVSLWLDEITLVPSTGALQPESPHIIFSTARAGNLFFPGDALKVTIRVEADRPLSQQPERAIWTLRDYTGTEAMPEATVVVATTEKRQWHSVYNAVIDIDPRPVEVGRYYELHLRIPRSAGSPIQAHTSLAVIPEASTKKYQANEIPFTSRNWDNRLEAFIRLTDRLGVRVCGIWGGWSAKPPYTAEAPGLALCHELGMGWLTTTPAMTIEAGKTDYDERALRHGVKNLIEQFGSVRPIIVSLGNEPHVTGRQLLTDMRAYRTTYEEIKRVDPRIFVLATAVEPNEEYFKAGYGRWCDAYDFHCYEGAKAVVSNIEKYRELMARYGPTRPIWSTELGLRSRGMPRSAVAAELIKMIVSFFAEGGQNASWFGYLYPDRDGSLAGGGNDALDLFNSGADTYSPRLDAIAYYHLINSIGVKKFKAQRTYPRGIRAFLFQDRDGQSLQVIWSEAGREKIAIPLAPPRDVRVIRIDGHHTAENIRGTLEFGIADDPVLILYTGGPGALPDRLAPR